MSHFNIIFPMAGESKRFDYQFKPFLKLSDITFIELAYKFFKIYEDRIDLIYFIITQEQENDFHIDHELQKMFSNYKLIILSEKTAGPFVTIQNALSEINTDIPSFICDCDHSIDISPMIDFIDQSDSDYSILIPYWDVKKHNENINDWGIMYLDQGKIINFSEKFLINDYSTYFGIIGCYYFKDLSFFKQNGCINITDGLYDYRFNSKPIEIKHAEFFGDQKRLIKTIHLRKKIKTIFCDIDGTIIKHEANPKNDTFELLSNSLQKLQGWKEKGYRIIITTSRTKKEQVAILLQKNKSDIRDHNANLVVQRVIPTVVELSQPIFYFRSLLVFPQHIQVQYKSADYSLIATRHRPDTSPLRIRSKATLISSKENRSVIKDDNSSFPAL